MRSKINILLMFISMLILGVSCGDNDKADSLNSNALQIKSSSDTLVLSEELKNEIALTFSWNEGISHGSEFTTSYLFKMDLLASNFSKDTTYITTKPTDTETYDSTVNTRSFTHGELNDLILNHWKVFPGDETDIVARIVAKLDGPKFIYPEIAYQAVNIRTFKATPKPLYLVGSATNAKDDPGKGIPVIEEKPQHWYTWEGELTEGGFKLISQRTSMLPSLNRGSEKNSFYERIKEDQPDELFPVESAGLYRLILDRKNNYIEYAKPLYNKKIWVVGNATTAGWTIAKSVPLTWNNERINIFTFEGPLAVGEFKFPAEKLASFSTPFLLAPYANVEINSKGVADPNIVYSSNGKPDNKWKVTEAGNYRITIDGNNMTIKAEWLD